MATRIFSRSLFSRISNSTALLRLRPLSAAPTNLHLGPFEAAAMARGFATRNTSSSLSDPNPNCSNRHPKETVLPDGCDFEHWLVVMEKPEGDPTRDEIIDSYIKTLATVLGSEEEARMKIYSVSTRHYFAFGALVSGALSYKLKELPNVLCVLPDSYLDVENKDYGGEPFINGQAVPYDPKYHEEWVRNNALAQDLPDSFLDAINKDYGGQPFINSPAVPYDPEYHEEWVGNNAIAQDKNRRNDSTRNFERRRETMQNLDVIEYSGPPPNMPHPQHIVPSPRDNYSAQPRDTRLRPISTHQYYRELAHANNLIDFAMTLKNRIEHPNTLRCFDCLDACVFRNLHAWIMRFPKPPLRNKEDEDCYSNIPPSIDWREKGAVTGVKNQGDRPTCWAFAVCAAIEGFVQIRIGRLESLSVEQLIQLNQMHFNKEGGYIVFGYWLVVEYNGVASWSVYPYGSRHPNGNFISVATIQGFKTVPTFNEAALKAAVSKQPVTATVYISRNFRHYSGGVFSQLSIGVPSGINHAVLIVGYDIDKDGIAFWLIKNSYGTRWGEKGYMRLEMGTNKVGLSDEPSFPI